MSARFLRLALAALVLILVGGACNRPPDNPQDYAARIAVARAEKNEQFQKSSEPIPASKKAEFLPLAYFPIDPEYDVVAALTLSSDDTKLMMPTSFVILDRVVWGMCALLGQLGARNRWRDLFEEYRFDMPPKTDLGRAERAWRDSLDQKSVGR